MSHSINDDHTQREHDASPERWIDEIDSLFRSTLQQAQQTEPAYDRIWTGVKERIVLREQQQIERLYHACSEYAAESGWRLRCQWHTIELDLALSLSPLR